MIGKGRERGIASVDFNCRSAQLLDVVVDSPINFICASTRSVVAIASAMNFIIWKPSECCGESFGLSPCSAFARWGASHECCWPKAAAFTPFPAPASVVFQSETRTSVRQIYRSLSPSLCGTRLLGFSRPSNMAPAPSPARRRDQRNGSSGCRAAGKLWESWCRSEVQSSARHRRVTSTP